MIAFGRCSGYGYYVKAWVFVRVTATLLLCGMLSQVDIFFFLVYCVRWGLDCLRLSFLLLVMSQVAVFFFVVYWVLWFRLGFLLLLFSQSCCLLLLLLVSFNCVRFEFGVYDWVSFCWCCVTQVDAVFCGLPSTVKSRILRVMGFVWHVWITSGVMQVRVAGMSFI